MNVYHVYREDDVDYDEWDGAIIIAESEEKAREIANNGMKFTRYELNKPPYQFDWSDKEKVKCEVVNQETQGIVLSSFNAG